MASKKKTGKALLLQSIPPDVYVGIIKAQCEHKAHLGISQFSLESTVYMMLRKLIKSN
jgi:hypothetical protein